MPDDESTTEEGWTRPFADLLVSLNRGRSHTELSTAMKDLVAAVLATGKKGSLVLRLDITKNKADMIEVVDTVTVKAPRSDRAASIFFADDDHNLVRDDPRQMQLPLVDINADQTRPLKDVK